MIAKILAVLVFLLIGATTVGLVYNFFTSHKRKL